MPKPLLLLLLNPVVTEPEGERRFCFAYRRHLVGSTGQRERRIISIASAPGWGALFEQADDPFGEPRLVTLAAWALVDEGDGQARLVGLVQQPQRDDAPGGTFGLADEHEGFAGYSNQGLKTKPAE